MTDNKNLQDIVPSEQDTSNESLSFYELRFLYYRFNSLSESESNQELREKLHRMAVAAWKKENPHPTSFLV